MSPGEFRALSPISLICLFYENWEQSLHDPWKQFKVQLLIDSGKPGNARAVV